jgi:hypothetical protein
MKKTIGTALLFLLVAAPAMAGPNGGSAGSHGFSGTSTRVFSGDAQPHGNDPAGFGPPATLKSGDPAQRDNAKSLPTGRQLPADWDSLVERKPRCVMVPSPDLRGITCLFFP